MKEYVASYIYMNDIACDEVESRTKFQMELNTLKDVLVEKDAELAAKDAELADILAKLAVLADKVDTEMAELRAKLAVLADQVDA